MFTIARHRLFLSYSGYILMLSSHLRLLDMKGVFDSDFPQKPRCHVSPNRATFPPQFSLFDSIFHTISGEEYRS
jgi:hypothetical protein